MAYNRETAKPRWKAGDIPTFCGWEFLQKMVGLANPLGIKLLVVAAFLTGGRINETLRLETKHFDFGVDPQMVVVKAMPLSKRYEKTGKKIKWKCDGHCKMRWGGSQRPSSPTEIEQERHNIVEYDGWETKPREAYRTFPFPKTEPLVSVLQELMPNEGPLFDIGYDTAYAGVTEIGKQLGVWIPTHWFRAQRASQLAYEYGFEEHALTDWFVWRDYLTAFAYARMGYKGLAAKMVRL